MKSMKDISNIENIEDLKLAEDELISIMTLERNFDSDEEAIGFYESICSLLAVVKFREYKCR